MTTSPQSRFSNDEIIEAIAHELTPFELSHALMAGLTLSQIEDSIASGEGLEWVRIQYFDCPDFSLDAVISLMRRGIDPAEAMHAAISVAESLAGLAPK